MPIQHNNYRNELSTTYPGSDKDNASKLNNFRITSASYASAATVGIGDLSPTFTLTLKAEITIVRIVPIVCGVTLTANDLNFYLVDHNNV